MKDGGEKEVYRLVGFLNHFNEVPAFVYPVFTGPVKNVYYIQDGEEDILAITRFVPIIKHKGIPEVKLFDETMQIQGKTDTEMTVDEEMIFAYQDANYRIYIGTLEEIKDFLQNYNPQNEIIRKNINCFLETAGTNVKNEKTQIAQN